VRVSRRFGRAMHRARRRAEQRRALFNFVWNLAREMHDAAWAAYLDGVMTGEIQLPLTRYRTRKGCPGPPPALS
jgi:hypothetical protein